MLRATLKSLLSRKVRLLLSALAVVLGVMSVSSAFVLTDTLGRAFDSLFAGAYAHTDVEVTAKPNPTVDDPAEMPGNLPAGTVRTIKSDVAGVADAFGLVAADGARVIGKNGKVVATTGAPRFGTGWTSADGTAESLIELRTGEAPDEADEIAINASLAETGGFAVGDRVEVITLAPRRAFTLVGIFGYRGGRDSLGGETIVAFTMPAAQELMLGRLGVYTQVDVTADAGVTPDELSGRVASHLGPGFEVRTGAQAAAEQSQELQGFTTGLKTGLVVFALIGLFAGAFLIFNTFSMLVAQRTRELALYRAFGASRGQVNRSVLIESVLLGLASALVGLVLGFGVGWLLVKGLESLSGSDLPGNGVAFRPYVIVTTLLVGTLFTVAAAMVPALRASRVAPVAAMRDATIPDRPLWKLTLAGGIVFVAGVVLIALALTDTVKGRLGLLLGAGGVLGFLGVAMLAPAISRPVTAALGRLFGRGVAGRLGSRNTGRNPRRTAVTAAALMIGVTLATGAGVFASSAKAGVSKLFRQDLNAELIVLSDLAGGLTAGFDPAAQAAMRAIPGVDTALALRMDQVSLGGSGTVVQAGDVEAAKTIFRLEPLHGEIRALSAGEILLDEGTATARNLGVDDLVEMRTARGGAHPERVVGVFAKNTLAAAPFVSTADAATFTSPLAQAGYVKVTDPDQIGGVRTRLAALFASNPEVSVVDATELAKQQGQLLDVVLTILNLLLGLTIIVAVLGVINTLLLSVFERTREIGLIRAVGMSRAQTGLMITVESVLISVFGALLGIVAGVALGIAVVSAIRSSGFVQLTIPWVYLVVTLILGILAGVIAAILPAIRAARLNVLDAIAYE